MNKKYLFVGSILILLSIYLLSYTFNERKVHEFILDGIPIIYVEPSDLDKKVPLVIWLDGFTGRKENTLEKLVDLADRGYLAVSFDAYEHGERALPGDNLWNRAFETGNFQSEFWNIVGHTSDDSIKVIDWAQDNFNIYDEVSMGGFSMGGDISVVVAGIDTRVHCVAAVVSTPDWLHPGMNLNGTDILQGQANETSQLYYDRMDPITHTSSYSHEPAISFESGKNDFFIPYVWILPFEEALKDIYQNKEKIQLVIHENTGHELTPEMWTNCLNWFDKHDIRKVRK